MTPGPGLHRTQLPLGFKTSGVNSGVRRYRPDFGLIYSEVDACAAGVFTLNSYKAAPVEYSLKLLPSSNIRAIVTNSGQANAATGTKGVEDNLAIAQAVAQELTVSPNQVLMASTGVIGAFLAMDKLLPVIPEMILRLNDVAESFALAILTTDLVPKAITTVVELSTGPCRITGICKGSGMIHPNMATMLGYLLTDANISSDLCHTFLKEVTDLSFNMISVDGDTSTNDCVFMLANGVSGASLVTDQDHVVFKKALLDVSQFLAKSIAADGEGATKLIEVKIKGAANLHIARQAVRAITLSPLIKSAIHGEDPNWGRILAKLGAAEVPFEWLNNMNLKIQDHLVFEKGSPSDFDRALVKESLKTNQVNIYIDFDKGVFEAKGWGCDLSKKYVEINAEYS